MSKYSREIADVEKDLGSKLWDQPSSSLFQFRASTQQADIISMAFTTGGRLIALIRYQENNVQEGFQLVDVTSGATVGRFLRIPRRFTSFFEAIVFSAETRTVAVGGFDRAVRLWNATSGEQIGLPLRGHEGAVSSVAFSPDGRLIASASLDRTVRIWDVRSGMPIGVPFSSSDPSMSFADSIVSLEFSSDGRLIASGSVDGTVQLWSASPQEWFLLSCARMAHHPLLRDPASVSTDPELVAAGRRVRQACQAASPARPARPAGPAIRPRPRPGARQPAGLGPGVGGGLTPAPWPWPWRSSPEADAASSSPCCGLFGGFSPLHWLGEGTAP